MAFVRSNLEIVPSLSDWSRSAGPAATPDFRYGHLTISRDCVSDEAVLSKVLSSFLFRGTVIFVGSPSRAKIAHYIATFNIVHAQCYDFTGFLEHCTEQRARSGRHGWKGGHHQSDYTVIFDTETTMSAACGLALIAAVHRTVELSQQCASACIRLLTMSTEPQLDALRSLLAHYGISRRYYFATDLPDRETLKPHHVRKVINFLEVDPDQALQRELDIGLLKQLLVQSRYLDSLSGHPITSVDVDVYGYKTWGILLNSEDVKYYLTYLPPAGQRNPLPLGRYHHIHFFLTTHRHHRIYDAVTHQIASVLLPTCLEERADEVASTVRIDSVPNGISIYINAPTVDAYISAGCRNRRLGLCNDQAGAFLSALGELSTWGVDVDEITPYFFTTPMEQSALSTISHRLTVQRLLSNEPTSLCLDENHMTAFRAILPYNGIDHRTSLFLCLPSKSTAALLFKIRWAILMSIDLDHLIVFPNCGGIKAQGNYRILLDESVPWSSPVSKMGTTWIPVALWKYVDRSLIYQGGPQSGKDRIEIPGTGIKVVTSAYCQVSTMIRNMEDRLGRNGISTSGDAAAGHRELSPDEILELQRHLLYAYVFQLTKTVGTGDLIVEDVSTGTMITPDNSLDFWIRRTGDVTGQSIGPEPVFGVYSNMTRETNTNLVRIEDWTWIPSTVVAE